MRQCYIWILSAVQQAEIVVDERFLGATSAESHDGEGRGWGPFCYTSVRKLAYYPTYFEAVIIWINMSQY